MAVANLGALSVHRMSRQDRLATGTAVALVVALVASLTAAVAMRRDAASDITADPVVAQADMGVQAETPVLELTAPEGFAVPDESLAVDAVAEPPAAEEPQPGFEPVDAAEEASASAPAVEEHGARGPPAASEAMQPAQDSGQTEPRQPASADEPPEAEQPEAQEAQPAPAPASEPAPAPEPAREQEQEREQQAQAAGASSSEQVFAQEFPQHAAARQTDDPGTHGWAVLVGVNRYQGRTGNTLGSVADVMVLRQVLLAHGWRDEHILVLTDHAATHDRIVRGIEWLTRKTDERSTVVFSFSGHMRHTGGVSAIWPTDNRFLWAGDFGRMMGAVRSARMWVTLQGCHAEGLRAPGLEGANRIITYSSRLPEKSYEDPEVGHSVQGWFMFAEGFRDGHGDLDGDGRISVHEAYNWAAPRAHSRTSGRQSPVVSDGLRQPLFLHLGQR